MFQDATATAPIVSVQFQPNFMINMLVMLGMLGNIGYYFLAICPKLKISCHFDFLLTHDHMGLKISKRYSLYSFYSTPGKPRIVPHEICIYLLYVCYNSKNKQQQQQPHEYIGYHCGIQAVTFIDNQPSS